MMVKARTGERGEQMKTLREDDEPKKGNKNGARPPSDLCANITRVIMMFVEEMRVYCV